jgi:hypothetical protein
MASAEENKYHLEELNGSNYQIVEGEPDITGWDVIDGQGRVIGEVDDVLFDPNSRAVRYIIVDLEENELDIDTDKKVLVPIGIAELQDQYDEDATENNTFADNDTSDGDDDEEDDDVDEEVVYLPTVTAEQLLALPAYEKGALTPEKEVVIRSIFERPTTEAIVVYEKDSFYTHDHFNNKIYPRNDTGTTGFQDNDYKSPDNDRNHIL